jgi:enoyl-CoA hydratase/carnithine racemase
VTEHVLVEKSNKVLTLTLNRPEKKNALTGAMYRTLSDAILSADQASDIHCVLIQANGETFTAGNDLEGLAALASAGELSLEETTPFLPALAGAKTPIVAAVNGRAVGIGVTMLLHCDLVFVATNALLSTPFVNLGVVPEAASSLLLPLRIGHVRAFEMFVLNEVVDAERAVSWGLANRAVESAELRRTARAAARAIAERAPAAVLATKKLMRDEAAILARMARESALFVQQLKSPEFQEAFAAFYAGRAPTFGKVI